MKFEISFNYLDTEDKTVKGYDYHPLYDEIKGFGPIIINEDLSKVK